MSPAKGQFASHCKHGHEIAIVGRAANGGCNECIRLRYERRGLKPKQAADVNNIRFRNPICPRGHDKRIVGVSDRYRCKECVRLSNISQTHKQYWIKRRRREAGINADPGPVKNLRAIRIRLGLTMAELAGMIGIRRSTLSRLETGTRNASRRMQRRILDVLTPLLAEEAERIGRAS